MRSTHNCFGVPTSNQRPKRASLANFLCCLVTWWGRESEPSARPYFRSQSPQSARASARSHRHRFPDAVLPANMNRSGPRLMASHNTERLQRVRAAERHDHHQSQQPIRRCAHRRPTVLPSRRRLGRRSDIGASSMPDVRCCFRRNRISLGIRRCRVGNCKLRMAAARTAHDGDVMQDDAGKTASLVSPFGAREPAQFGTSAARASHVTT